MITLDQVLLLQEKVETAVGKIEALSSKILQLESENDALRSKCAELSKAVSEKSELVSTLEDTQNKIEQSILLTLTRLDDVENEIIGDSNQVVPTPSVSSDETVEVVDTPSIDETSIEPEEPNIFGNFSSDRTSAESNDSAPTQDINGQFDIF